MDKAGSLSSGALCCRRRHQYLCSPPTASSQGPHFVSRLIGAHVPAAADRRAEEALPSSHTGLLAIPSPLRRGVLRRCISRRFAPSMIFAHVSRARLPLVPLAGLNVSTRQASREVTDWRVAQPLDGSLSRRFTGRLLPGGGRQLPGCLVITRAGLTPAGQCEFSRERPDAQ